jgi:hypothetical protein
MEIISILKLESICHGNIITIVINLKYIHSHYTQLS